MGPPTRGEKRMIRDDSVPWETATSPLGRQTRPVGAGSRGDVHRLGHLPPLDIGGVDPPQPLRPSAGGLPPAKAHSRPVSRQHAAAVTRSRPESSWSNRWAPLGETQARSVPRSAATGEGGRNSPHSPPLPTVTADGLSASAGQRRSDGVPSRGSGDGQADDPGHRSRQAGDGKPVARRTDEDRRALAGFGRHAEFDRLDRIRRCGGSRCGEAVDPDRPDLFLADEKGERARVDDPQGSWLDLRRGRDGGPPFGWILEIDAEHVAVPEPEHEERLTGGGSRQAYGPGEIVDDDRPFHPTILGSQRRAGRDRLPPGTVGTPQTRRQEDRCDRVGHVAPPWRGARPWAFSHAVI